MDKRSKFNSKIAQRISKKMFVIYFIIYLVILLALLLILTPILYKNKVKSAIENLAIVKDEYQMLQEQIAGSITNLYLSDILNNLLESYSENPDKTIAAQISQELSEYTTKNADLLIICIETENGNFFSSYYYPSFDKQGFLYENSHYMRLLSSSTGSYFSPVNMEDFFTGNTYHKAISYTQKVTVGMQAYIVDVFYNANTVINRCDSINASEFAGYTITDRYSDTIYTTHDFLVPISSETYISLSGYKNTKNGIYFYNTIPSSGWVITAYVPYFQMLSTLIVIMGIITGLYLFSPILYILFLIPTTRKQLAPLRELSDTMTSFTVGQYVQSIISSNDEIENLSNSFNEMVLKINQQVLEIKKQEHENSVVNYKLLSTQIDPHFIYNTMNIINIMARQGNTAAVIEINSALIKILRERLNSKLVIYDTIKNELETLHQYELIMDYRYHNKVTTHYFVDSPLLQQKIPKNLLQPLIENSYYHGFSREDTMIDGNVDVMIYSIEEELIIEVSDNGCGISQERLEKLCNSDYSIYRDKKPHIGIDNIRQRLSYIYGSHHQFEIHSTEGLGTTIIITIPLQIPE